MDYDNGMVNRLEPERTYYEIPDKFHNLLNGTENALGKLTTEELNDFVCGAKYDQIQGNYIPNLTDADQFLTLYFNQWD